MGRQHKLLFLVMLPVSAVTALLCRFNPVEQPLFPPCMFHSLTGLSCPGCGMQRFVHAMLQGRPAEAVGYNYLMIVVVPYALLFLLERLVLTGRPQLWLRRVVEGRVAATTVAVLIPMWFVVRNILNV